MPIHMDDPLSPQRTFVLKDYLVQRMVLSPDHWTGFTSPRRLRWKEAKFDRGESHKVPNNKVGVYSFVVRPGIADHPSCSYLMYIGKAEEQSLRERFLQYFNDITETSRRPNISKMIRMWQNHLWFYFAPIPEADVDGTEQALLNSYLPPVNKQYKGIVSVQIRDLFAA